MAKLNEIRFFLLVSLMIFPTRAFDVILANDEGNYKITAEIETMRLENGKMGYLTHGFPEKYTAKESTTRVILYIISAARFSVVMNEQLCGKRMQVSEELSKGAIKTELFYLVLDHFDINHDEPAIRCFIRDMIKPPASHRSRKYEYKTIGNINLTKEPEFAIYKETSQVFDGKLQEHLDAIKL